MVHLIWSIANFMLVLYFVYLFFGFIFQGKKIVKSKFKTISIFILAIGIFQLISASITENQVVVNQNLENKPDSKLKLIVLEENLTFNFNLNLEYSYTNNRFKPISYNSFLTGLVSGHAWELRSFDLNNKSEFTAAGDLKWTILGIPLYSETKKFNGKIR